MMSDQTVMISVVAERLVPLAQGDEQGVDGEYQDEDRAQSADGEEVAREISRRNVVVVVGRERANPKRTGQADCDGAW